MIGFPIEHPSFEWVFLWSVVHILFVVWLVFLWTSFLWIGLSMISSSYIWSWHIWFSYDQPFLYLRSYVCVPIFIHGINGLPISVHRIIGFLMNSLPIIAFLYLRSYDCVFLYPCLPVERGGSIEISLSLQCKIIQYKFLWQYPMKCQGFFFPCVRFNNQLG